MTRAPCRRRTGEALPRAQKFGDLITQSTKSSMRDVNLETITGTLSWYKILQLNGFSLIRAKQNLHMRRNTSVVKFLEPSQAPKGCLYVQFDGIWEGM